MLVTNTGFIFAVLGAALCVLRAVPHLTLSLAVRSTYHCHPHCVHEKTRSERSDS